MVTLGNIEGINYGSYTASVPERRDEPSSGERKTGRSAAPAQRDYRLAGPEGASAAARGLVCADWYASPISRKRMKELMQRRDGPAIRDTVIWLVLLGGSGWLGHHVWRTWWAIPVFAVYGVLYGSVADSRWHECAHGTAFKTPWMNTVVYNVASFMMLREAVSWKWSHFRHHSDTIIVGRDAEIAFPRPTSLLRIASEVFALQSVRADVRKIAVNCAGCLTDEECDYLPESERAKAIRTARVYALILVGVTAWSVTIRSVEPLMFVGLPTLYGRWLALAYGITQHAGLAEDVLDHRLNSRSVDLNRLHRYLYWNMNFHIEHHMFPTVPYHALPALHDEIKADLPPICPGLLAAYREIFPALFRQRKDLGYCIVPVLPEQQQSGAASALSTLERASQ